MSKAATKERLSTRLARHLEHSVDTEHALTELRFNPAVSLEVRQAVEPHLQKAKCFLEAEARDLFEELKRLERRCLED